MKATENIERLEVFLIEIPSEIAISEVGLALVSGAL